MRRRGLYWQANKQVFMRNRTLYAWLLTLVLVYTLLMLLDSC